MKQYVGSASACQRILHKVTDCIALQVCSYLQRRALCQVYVVAEGLYHFVLWMTCSIGAQCIALRSCSSTAALGGLQHTGPKEIVNDLIDVIFLGSGLDEEKIEAVLQSRAVADLLRLSTGIGLQVESRNSRNMRASHRGATGDDCSGIAIVHVAAYCHPRRVQCDALPVVGIGPPSVILVRGRNIYYLRYSARAQLAGICSNRGSQESKPGCYTARSRVSTMIECGDGQP